MGDTSYWSPYWEQSWRMVSFVWKFKKGGQINHSNVAVAEEFKIAKFDPIM